MERIKLVSLSENGRLVGMATLLFIVAAIILRRPDIILNAQPWAEDGTIWIQNLYNNGLFESLIKPQNGYYQTIARVIYSFSMIFGLENAPLSANLCSIAVRVAFVFFVLSKRFSYIDFRFRLAFILYFLLMPNISEGYVNATNVQWYLAIYMIAFLIAEKPLDSSWKVHDFFLVMISSMSGPFVVFLSIPYLIKRLNENGGLKSTIKFINANDIIFTLCFLIQLSAILHSQSQTRSSAPLGASIVLFCDIFYYKLIHGLLLDNSQTTGTRGSFLHVISTLVSFLLIGYLSIIKTWRFNVILLSIVIIVGFGLSKPMMSLDKNQWDFFLLPVGDRYFLLPQIGVFCVILALLATTGKYANYLLFIFTAVCMLFYLKSYKIDPLPDIKYRDQIAEFKSLNSGEKYDVNIFPPGWKIELIKK